MKEHARLLSVLALLALVGTVACAATVVVRPGDTNGWTFTWQQGTATLPPEFGYYWCEKVPISAPPGGIGAFREESKFGGTTNPLEKLYLSTNNHNGTVLNTITNLRYWTYWNSTDKAYPQKQPPVLELIIWNGDPNTNYVALVYLPWDKGISSTETWGPNNAPLVWQEWDTMATSGHWYYYVAGSGIYSQAGTGTWAELMQLYGNWYIVDHPGLIYSTKDTIDFKGINIRVGAPFASGNFSWKEGVGIPGYVDMFTIGINGVDTTYDFEPRICSTIAEVKKYGLEGYAELQNYVVTGAWLNDVGVPERFAIEEPDRSCGISVVSSYPVSEGSVVNISGKGAYKNIKEFVISASVVTDTGQTAQVPAPVQMDILDSAGGEYGAQPAVLDDAASGKFSCGVNTVGMLMRLRGRVTARADNDNYSTSYFYIDDAYVDSMSGASTGVNDGTGTNRTGIMCRPAPWMGIPLDPPAEGSEVEVVGVMGVTNNGTPNQAIRYFWTKSVTEAQTGTFSKQIPAQWNLLSVPNQPQTPDPALVIGGGSPENIDGCLYGWDGCSQSMVLYDMWSPASFGYISNARGYWLKAAQGSTVSYTGYVEPTPRLDKLISVPTGWNIIGFPAGSATLWESWRVLDGAENVSVYDASYTKGWLQSTGYLWDASTQSLVDFGVADDFPTTLDLRPWHGHWVKTYKDVGLLAVSP